MFFPMLCKKNPVFFLKKIQVFNEQVFAYSIKPFIPMKTKPASVILFYIFSIIWLAVGIGVGGAGEGGKIIGAKVGA